MLRKKFQRIAAASWSFKEILQFFVSLAISFSFRRYILVATSYAAKERNINDRIY